MRQMASCPIQSAGAEDATQVRASSFTQERGLAKRWRRPVAISITHLGDPCPQGLALRNHGRLRSGHPGCLPHHEPGRNLGNKRPTHASEQFLRRHRPSCRRRDVATHGAHSFALTFDRCRYIQAAFRFHGGVSAPVGGNLVQPDAVHTLRVYFVLTDVIHTSTRKHTTTTRKRMSTLTAVTDGKWGDAPTMPDISTKAMCCRLSAAYTGVLVRFSSHLREKNSSGSITNSSSHQFHKGRQSYGSCRTPIEKVWLSPS